MRRATVGRVTFILFNSHREKNKSSWEQPREHQNVQTARQSKMNRRLSESWQSDSLDDVKSAEIVISPTQCTLDIFHPHNNPVHPQHFSCRVTVLLFLASFHVSSFGPFHSPSSSIHPLCFPLSRCLFSFSKAPLFFTVFRPFFRCAIAPL